MAYDAQTGEAEPIVIDERDDGIALILDDGRELVFDRTELVACVLDLERAA